MQSRFVPKLIPINHHRMAVLDLNPESSGEPIVLLHGITHSVGSWLSDAVFRQLGHCYAISLPGHYPAAFADNFKSSQLTTDLIAHLIASTIKQTVGDQPITLVGYSTGGYAALAIAALYPKLVKKVVILAGFLQGTWIGLGAYWQENMASLWGRIELHAQFEVVKRIPTSTFTKSYLWRISSGQPAIAPDNPLLKAFVPPMHAYFRHMHNRSVMHYFEQMPRTDIRDLAPQIKQPTLVLFGSRDPIVPPEQGHLIADLVPKAHKVVLADCGHLLMLERPIEYERTIGEWYRHRA